MARIEHIGDATLYLGDCRDVLGKVSGVDAVVCDPPYGVNLGNHAAAKETRKGWLAVGGYESYDDTPENLVEIVVPAIATALSIARRGLVFCADKNIHLFPRPSNIGGVFLPAPCGRNSWGFNSLMHCLLYGVAPDLHLGARPTAIASTETAEKNGHPTPKPLGWMRWAVNLASRPGDTVLDPFMGSGTTGVACIQLGRKFIGIEIEPKYFDIACRRIEEASKQGDLIRDVLPKPEQKGLDL
jgi:site-specific DNA-methyltransferase (adenine-specific)